MITQRKGSCPAALTACCRGNFCLHITEGHPASLEHRPSFKHTNRGTGWPCAFKVYPPYSGPQFPFGGRLLAALLVMMRPLRSGCSDSKDKRAPPPLPPPPPHPQAGPWAASLGSSFLSLNSPRQHPLHTVPCPPARLAGVCCCWGAGTGETAFQEGLPFDSQHCPPNALLPTTPPDPQRASAPPPPKGEVETEEPGSGPGSCWVTLGKSLRISEPQFLGMLTPALTCKGPLISARYSGLHK